VSGDWLWTSWSEGSCWDLDVGCLKLEVGRMSGGGEKGDFGEMIECSYRKGTLII